MSTNLCLRHLSGKTRRHVNEHMDAYYWFSKWGEGQTAVSLTSRCAKTCGPLMKLGITLSHAHEDTLKGRRRSMCRSHDKRIHQYCFFHPYFFRGEKKNQQSQKRCMSKKNRTKYILSEQLILCFTFGPVRFIVPGFCIVYDKSFFCCV